MKTDLLIRTLETVKLVPNKVKAIFPLGSHVYGTNNKDSDYDFIVIVNEIPEIGSIQRELDKNIDIHYYTVEEFQLKLDNHDIQMLECFFLPEDMYSTYIDLPFTFELDKSKLRKSISTIVNNSWVRGKKKLVVSGDYDLNLALKSIFYSIRILGLGIQIASHGKIITYKEYNWLLDDLYKMSKVADKDVLWKNIETKYKHKLFKTERSKFKSLCPNPKYKDNKTQLTNILKKHKIEVTTSLIDEILDLIN